MQEVLARLLDGQDLSADESQTMMSTIMSGGATDAQIGAVLTALRMKGETIDEITGAATVMRALSNGVDVDDESLVDTCGTGGDGAGLFNVSTGSAIIAAAAGVTIAKHGNRSVSSKSGSADLLEAAGVSLDLDSTRVEQCIQQVGIGFMFAPAHHGAMKHAIGPRRELAARTIFNLLGPLTNPAGAKNQVLGVFSKDWLLPLAEVLRNLESRHVMVVHSEDGLDEISCARSTYVAELRDGRISEMCISPEDFGLKIQPLDPLLVDTPEESLSLISGAFSNTEHPAADILALNAGAAIYVGGVAKDLKEGVDLAMDALGSGAAKSKLEELVVVSKELSRSMCG